jgi:DNA-binding winged helix-turn-helix (wHTH) protein
VVQLSATQQLLRFGIFELSLATGELRKSGTVVKVPPQSFKLLALLVSRPGQVVTREEIQNQLWGEETYVDFEQGVNKCIKQIRAALNDNADQPLYVETIPRYGYRFLAPVTSKTVLVAPPRLKESSSGIEGEIADRVIARMAATSAMAPADTPTPAKRATAPQPRLEVMPAPAARRSRTAIQSAAVRHWKLLTGLLVVVAAVALVVGGLYWYSHRPLTRVSAEEWVVAGSQPKSYEVGTDGQEIFNGHPSACLRSKEPDTGGFGTLMQIFQARTYLGKRVRLRAFAKTEGIKGMKDWAGLWMRVDKDMHPIAFDNMFDRPIKGTTGWQKYEVVLDVPQDATDIAFGVMLIGSGKVWLNDVEFEVVGSDIPTTGKGMPATGMPQLGDKPKLDFEN